MLESITRVLTSSSSETTYLQTESLGFRDEKEDEGEGAEEDRSENEVGLGSDILQSDRHDSDDTEGAEPLPHQTNRHGDNPVSSAKDLGDQGERTTAGTIGQLRSGT
jgi:hypothetical protein